MHTLPTPITNINAIATAMDTYIDSRKGGGYPSVILPTDIIPELVTNGDAPTTTTGWGLFGVPATHAISVLPGGGLQITNRTASAQGIQTVICPVNGVTYTFRMRVKTSSATPVNVTIGVKIINGATSYIPDGALKAETVGSDWRYVSFTWKATAGCGSGTFYFFVNGAPSAINMYVEKASVEGPLTSYVPTPIPHFVKRVGDHKEIGTTGKPFLEMGMNLNAYYEGMSDPTQVYNLRLWDWDVVFAHLRGLGFNSVRLMLWYRLFENDATPGVWDETGFAWLNTVIARARSYGMCVLLDMHAPQAGYQSYGYSGPFWGTDPVYRNRLKALWVEIATRYKDEPYVIGYDLINEPCCANTSQLVAYLMEVRAAIRAVDPNHFIHFESNFGDDTAYDIPANSDDIIADSHSYPYLYAESLITEKTNDFTGLHYPETVKKVPLYPSSMTTGVNRVGQTSSVAEGSGGWYWVSFTLPAMGPNTVAFCPAILTRNASGGVYVERVKVFEDSQQLDHFMIEKTPANTWDHLMWENSTTYGFNAGALDPNPNFYSSGSWPKIGTCTVTTGTTNVESGKTSLRIVSGSAGVFRGVYSSRRRYMVDPAKTYRVDALVYLGSGTVLADVQVGGVVYDAKYPDDTVVFNKDGLTSIIDNGMESASDGLLGYLTTRNVLGCIGEFGISTKMYQGWGAQELLTDIIDWCATNNIALYLFEYRGTYGLYYGSTRGYPSDGLCLANTPMLNTLEAVLA